MKERESNNLKFFIILGAIFLGMCIAGLMFVTALDVEEPKCEDIVLLEPMDILQNKVFLDYEPKAKLEYKEVKK